MWTGPSSLERAEVTNSLGKQQLELSTRTRSFLLLENAANFSSKAASSNNFFCILVNFCVGKYKKIKEAQKMILNIFF